MCGALFQRAIRVGRVIACAALLAGCTSAIHNDPINQRLTANPAQVEAALTPNVPDNYDDMVVALSFSGGGTRAAAFSYGVLSGFDQTRVPTRTGAVSLLDRLDFLSGVSGGSILAAYYGLHGRAALGDFKQRFLDANAEEALQTSLSIGNIARGLQGGVNDTTAVSGLARRSISTITRRSSDLLSRPRPRVWINASDIYNRTAVHLRAGDLQRAVQRSVKLSGFAGGRGFRGGAGRVRADRHSKLSRRLPGRAAELG